MKAHHFCTYFNSGYLDRAIVLIESMRQNIGTFSLEVLCFDDATFDFFANHNFQEVQCQKLSSFEQRNPKIKATKKSRSKAEYFFTCTPSWICDVIERNPLLEVITYLDADMCFYNSPEPVFKLFESKSILITEHGFDAKDHENLKFGRFNVGWLSFRNNTIGKACVQRWRDQCIEWCYDRLEDGKFADQKYLDEWPNLYGDALMVGPPGLNCGPWGLTTSPLSIENGTVSVGENPLILYHFQGVRLFSAKHFYLGYYFRFLPTLILTALYFPYVKALVDAAKDHQLSSMGKQQRYAQGNLFYRLFTGYWVDKPRISATIWFLQHFVLRLGR